jgi:membrane-associated protease RseP (regulator of RpoE activity)
MGILTIVILLTISVVVHEWGHYIVMRRNNLKVDIFSVGFGPVLWRRTMKSGTEFRVCLIPLGGYVKGPHEGEGSLDTARPWVRLKVVMAGMFMNSVMSFIAFLAVFYALGGIPVKIAPYVAWIPHWLRIPAVAFGLSFVLWFATPPLIVWIIATKGLTGLLAGAVGPIGIFQMGHSQGAALVASTPGEYIVGLLMWSGLMLGLLNSGFAGANLIPILPLDGGHALDAIVEMVLGPKRVASFRKVFRPVSVALFIALIVVIFAGDFTRLFTGRPPGQ